MSLPSLDYLISASPFTIYELCRGHSGAPLSFSYSEGEDGIRSLKFIYGKLETRKYIIVESGLPTVEESILWIKGERMLRSSLAMDATSELRLDSPRPTRIKVDRSEVGALTASMHDQPDCWISVLRAPTTSVLLSASKWSDADIELSSASRP